MLYNLLVQGPQFLCLLEDLHPVIAKVDHDQLSLGRNAEPRGPVELAGSVALGAELVDEDALGAEDLDAVVATVGHDDVAFLVHGYTVGSGERAVFIALEDK